MHTPVDAAAQGIIDALSGSTPFAKMTAEELRAAVASFVGLQKPHEEVARAVDASYPDPAGELHVRIYVPEQGSSGPLPVVVYFHGGGFVAGSLAVAEEPNLALANDAGVIVVAAAYRLYLPTLADAENPHATPSRAASLAGLPPALVITTEFEVARDEAAAYAAQLAAADVPTEFRCVDGLIHCTYWMSGAVPRSREIHDAVVGFLRRTFNG